ncbi:hypothetical protein, partial [Neobacillus sp.]|uniref:hypothetical protein n=1 Tax=Neobacillus sp. TaxID=2675273 RepID=UPI002899FCE9
LDKHKEKLLDGNFFMLLLYHHTPQFIFIFVGYTQFFCGVYTVFLWGIHSFFVGYYPVKP